MNADEILVLLDEQVRAALPLRVNATCMHYSQHCTCCLLTADWAR